MRRPDQSAEESRAPVESDLVGGVRIALGVGAVVASVALVPIAIRLFGEMPGRRWDWLGFWGLIGGITGPVGVVLFCFLDPRLHGAADLWPKTWFRALLLVVGFAGIGMLGTRIGYGMPMNALGWSMFTGVWVSSGLALQWALGRLVRWQRLAAEGDGEDGAAG